MRKLLGLAVFLALVCSGACSDAFFDEEDRERAEAERSALGARVESIPVDGASTVPIGGA